MGLLRCRGQEAKCVNGSSDYQNFILEIMDRMDPESELFLECFLV